MSSDPHYGCPACRRYCSVTRAGVSACCGAVPDPSVTTVLNVISKPALIPWAVKMEREAIRAAFLELLTADSSPMLEDPMDPEHFWGLVMGATEAHKAADKAKTKAAEIGTAAHALIEWFTKRELGLMVPADPPEAPEAAQWSYMSWQDWARKVGFRPIRAEFVVYSTKHGYIGTGDTLGEVESAITLVDYKTSRAVYREAHLQNVAYRAALVEQEGGAWPRGLILRLPKVDTDPEFEPVEVTAGPEALSAFLGAKQLWSWLRVEGA